MPEDIFGDLMLIRKGGPELTRGGGPTTVEPVATREEWAIKAQALRDIFLQTLGEDPRIKCPLSVKVEYEKDQGDHVERRISYLVARDERVALLALIPKSVRRRAPAVLCIHPTQADGKEETVGRGSRAGTPEGENRAYGLHLVRRGYVTFSPDLLGSGERIYPGLKAFDNTPLYEKYPRWSGTGKDLWDLRRALDVLARIEEVDRTRIGSIGHSQGGGLTGYLMAVDERVKVGVSNCGMWPLRISKNPFNICRTGWWIGRPALRPFAWAGKPMPIDYHELLALSAPRPFMNISALNDCQWKAEEESFTRPAWENLEMNVKKVYALLGAPGGYRQTLHVRGHDFPNEMRDAAYAFLDEALKPERP